MDGSRQDITTFSELALGQRQLGTSAREFSVFTRDEVCAAVQSLAEQAQRSLLLHTVDLEPPVFDTEAFLEAVSRLGRAHGKAHVHILIEDSRHAVQQGHRLIELSRRLPSALQFRRPAAEYRDFHQSFLLADDSGYLHRPHAGRYEGTGNFHDPARVADWKKYFLEVWERSEPDTEIRRLHL